MPQHALGSENNQRLAPWTQRLSSQKMKILSGRRRLADLHVVSRRELQKALDARARVLRALTFIAVGKEQHNSGEKTPLIFGSRDELVDDDLGTVGEVAKLGFPEDE